MCSFSQIIISTDAFSCLFNKRCDSKNWTESQINVVNYQDFSLVRTKNLNVSFYTAAVDDSH